MKEIIKELIDLVYPDRCNFCSSFEGLYDRSLCCKTCYENLAFYKQAYVYDKDIYCVFHYKGILKEAFLNYKFKGETPVYKSFLYFLDKKLQEEGVYKKIDIITSVPLSRARFKERGFNQSKLIAKGLSNIRKIPYEDLLYRPSQDKTQSKLARQERDENINRFFLYEDIQIKDKRILLVDDLLTSGGTIKEIKGLLESANAQVYTALIASSRLDL